MRFDNKPPARPGKRPVIHNVHILDASDSMRGSKYSSAIEGINTEITTLKESTEPVDYTLTIVEFKGGLPDKMEILYFMQPLDKCKHITGTGAKGMTPLYQTIHKTFEKLLAKVKPEDKTIVTIFTDGGENDSTPEYRDPSFLRELISKVETNHNFTVTFMGTEFDVNQMVDKIKLKKSNTLVHMNNAMSIQSAYATRGASLTSYSKNVVEGLDVKENFFTKQQITK